MLQRTRLALGILILVTVVAAVTVGVAWWIEKRRSSRDAKAGLADPSSISFPPAAGEAGKKLLAAQEAHRAALRAFRERDQVAGGTKAQEAMRLYEEAGAWVAPLSGLEYEAVVSLSGDGRLDTALGQTTRWLERFPDDRLQRELLSKLLFQRGRYSEAAREIEILLFDEPASSSLLRRLLEARSHEGSQQRAMETVDRLLAAKGSSSGEEAQSLRVAAQACVRFQEHARALPLLERLMRLDSADKDVQLDLGRTLGALGRHGDALAILAVLHSDPDRAVEAYLETAACQAKEGKPAEAGRALTEVLLRDPTNAAAYHQLAAASRRLGKEAGAAAFERAAQSLAPSERERARISEARAAGRGADAAFARAQSLAFAGKYREAEEALADLSLRRSPAIAFRRARLYLDWLRVREAADILERLEPGSAPDAPEVAQLLAQARRMLAPGDRVPGGDVDPSIELRRKIAATPWPGAAPFLVGLAQAEASSDRVQAIAAARLARAADPRSVEAWRTLGRLLDQPEELFYRREAWKRLLDVAPGDGEAAAELARCDTAIHAVAEPR